MPDDRYANPGWQWGTYAPGTAPPIVFPVTVPEARQLVDAGWELYGVLPSDATPVAPIPAQPPPTAPPPTTVAPPSVEDVGGPEDAAPPRDFDVATPGAGPTEAPPVDAPETLPPPPLEGEYQPAPRGPVVFDDEGFPEFGYDREGPYKRRVIDVSPYDLVGPIVGRIGRAILGPYGSVLGELGPEVLGSGELPFPPIPQVSIPAPRVLLPEYPLSLPEPPAPEIDYPVPPDVMTVYPEEPWPDNPALDTTPAATAPPRMPSPVPTPTPAPTMPWWALITAGIISRNKTRTRSPPIPRPMYPGQPGPEPAISISTNSPPAQFADPLTPPAPFPGFDPLTPFQPGQLTSPLEGSGFASFTPTETPTDQEDRCRCREKKPKKRKKSPSSVIAHVKVFDRRMSTYSLKNLKRGHP